MKRLPLSVTLAITLPPVSVQRPFASSVSVWKLLNALEPISPIEPVPAVSSSRPPLPLTLPLNTAPGSTISRLAALLTAKVTAELEPEIVRHCRPCRRRQDKRRIVQ